MESRRRRFMVFPQSKVRRDTVRYTVRYGATEVTCLKTCLEYNILVLVYFNPVETNRCSRQAKLCDRTKFQVLCIKDRG